MVLTVFGFPPILNARVSLPGSGDGGLGTGHWQEEIRGSGQKAAGKAEEGCEEPGSPRGAHCGRNAASLSARSRVCGESGKMRGGPLSPRGPSRLFGDGEGSETLRRGRQASCRAECRCFSFFPAAVEDVPLAPGSPVLSRSFRCGCSRSRRDRIGSRTYLSALTPRVLRPCLALSRGLGALPVPSGRRRGPRNSRTSHPRTVPLSARCGGGTSRPPNVQRVKFGDNVYPAKCFLFPLLIFNVLASTLGT